MDGCIPKPHTAVALACFALLLIATDALCQSPVCDGFNPSASYVVRSLAVQADGKILVGGMFNTLGGQPCGPICRVNPDGTLDTGFNPGANNYVNSLAVQADGKILVGGNINRLGGQRRDNIGRLNADGTLDTGFNAGYEPFGATLSVWALAVQSDGKIIMGGEFTVTGLNYNRIRRLNLDGVVDYWFWGGLEDGANVWALAMQTDGNILVGGVFAKLSGQSRRNIGRLNPDGALDTGFNPGAGGPVWCLALQADGKILVGGDFVTLEGQRRKGIGRLNADGTLDTSFNPGDSGYVRSLAVQADGKILVGGNFSSLGGQTRYNIGRLNPDGTVDTGFNPGARGGVTLVLSLAVQADGKILVGGMFNTLGGQKRNFVGRLNATDPATQSLSYDGSQITWLRGGTSPEVWRTVFDWSSDGLLWTPLGEGTRIPGGWQLTNTIVPPQATLRARGFVAAGTSWFVEDYLGPLVWIAQPVSRTNNVGTTATFGGPSGGTPPLAYQWFKGGVAITDDARIAGANTAWLTLANVLGDDTGGYHLVVSNAFGSRTSVVATLTVTKVAPVISVQSRTDESIWCKLKGSTNAQYEVQTATNLPSAEEEWQPVTTLTLTNGWGFFDWTNTGEARRFFRAR